MRFIDRVKIIEQLPLPSGIRDLLAAEAGSIRERYLEWARDGVKLSHAEHQELRGNTAEHIVLRTLLDQDALEQAIAHHLGNCEIQPKGSLPCVYDETVLIVIVPMLLRLLRRAEEKVELLEAWKNQREAVDEMVCEVRGAEETNSDWTPERMIRNERVRELLDELRAGLKPGMHFGYVRGEVDVTSAAGGSVGRLLKGDKRLLRSMVAWGLLEKHPKEAGLDAVYSLRPSQIRGPKEIEVGDRLTMTTWMTSMVERSEWTVPATATGTVSYIDDNGDTGIIGFQADDVSIVPEWVQTWNKENEFPISTVELTWEDETERADFRVWKH